MLHTDPSVIELFKAKAAQVSTTLVEVKDLSEAAFYALEVCEKKELCPLLFTEADLPEGNAPTDQTDFPRKKTFAAPEVSDALFADLVHMGEERDCRMIKDGLRQHLAGIDVAFTLATAGIAETGTSVLPCFKEDTRIATMICEVHVIALPKSKIVKTSYELEEYLQALMSGTMYTAFISGSSRTSDIERVLTLGVHGPLELHIALMEE